MDNCTTSLSVGILIGKFVDLQCKEGLCGKLEINFKKGEIPVINKTQSFFIEDIKKIVNK